MPRNKKSYTLSHPVVSEQIWILYSSNRQFCFLDEIRQGYFGPHHRCGCMKCDRQLVLPEPSFTQRLDEVTADRRKNSK